MEADMHQMSRRQFLRVTGATLAGSSIAALGFAPTPALAEVRQYKLLRTTETRNTCPYCSVGCGILMYGLGDGAKNAAARIIHIEGDADQQGQVTLQVSAGDRSGKIVAELENVSKSYNRPIVSNFSATILRGDKEKPDSGTVKQGTKLQVAYFDQMRTQLNEEASLLETIAPGSDWVEVNGQRKHAMSYLSDFLFAPERARSPVKTLSGGERNRLLLARLFAKPANVLVLDEPTNDLDIDTLELLEELLEDYPGTVFLVSHDRMFLDNVVTQVIVAEGEGNWREFVGGYTDWERVRDTTASAKAAAAKAAPKVEAAPAAASAAAPASAKKKLSYKEQRELDELPKMCRPRS
eukprot:gene30756-38016_t